MSDTTIKKVASSYSPLGSMGQAYLCSGKHVSMRLWRETPDSREVVATQRDYETIGFVIKGRAELRVEGQTVLLNPGDSWLVPRGARHHYEILEPFEAVEATAPPANIHQRDEI